MQQRDLAEVVAGSLRRLRLTVDSNLDLAGIDQVEVIAYVSLLDDRITGADVDRLELGGKAFENGLRERGEDLHRPHDGGQER